MKHKRFLVFPLSKKKMQHLMVPTHPTRTLKAAKTLAKTPKRSALWLKLSA
jgi:hypothetical protein